jgi:cytochrome c-type biogenesis protein CcmH/NrfG
MQTSTGAHSPEVENGVPSQTVYGLAAICLIAGLMVGYFLLGDHANAAARIKGVPSTTMATTYPGGHPKMTLEQMKQMADVQSSTLLEQSKADPKNATLLVQIATIYQSSHQFKEASKYFEKSLKIDPKNVAARTQLASCLYYSNDIDGALAQLNQALKYDPKDPNALFNLGMIKYRGKNDARGAIATWQQLLKSNPDLDRKPIVENMIAEAKTKTITQN